ncbi:amidase domain-containing protein [Guptibacillus hwajinpoensis]|uniref:amidase domain-containing protein n=1 Tax=Guptibacillus hwajinpoensis TaxID=208199 RepID=UPI00273D5365|nr:amidase domain-containing protein [Pseudalkalibacillus hwajinpoensis]WLR58417.1 amidase domain-containing protein [Pseudalkalibacillus hwajinpoensis]
MVWGDQLKSFWKEQATCLLNGTDHSRIGTRPSEEEEAVNRYRIQSQNRGASVIRIKNKGILLGKKTVSTSQLYEYLLHQQFLIKQGEKLYQEERLEKRLAKMVEGELILDRSAEIEGGTLLVAEGKGSGDARLKGSYYDRLSALKYAERWWDDANPSYQSFDVDCTNYISQCLHAGKAPMRGYPDRTKGWWMKGNNWSYSWTVAHALRWHLSSSKNGLRAREVANPDDLIPGDIICYDFDGDGYWQHTTFVVDNDEKGYPLVNAHTTNSRMRYWAYEDSTAWTPEIKYKFFHIED